MVIDHPPYSMPRVGCNTGHCRVSVTVDTAHLAESLHNWAHPVCVRLLLDGLLPGQPSWGCALLVTYDRTESVVASASDKGARVRRTAHLHLLSSL